MGGSVQPAEEQKAPLRAFLLYFLRLGTVGFGGPIALASRMESELVQERGWIKRGDYLEGLAFAQLAPGPLAAQLAMYLGHVRAGVLGATAVAVAFIAPSFLIVVAISALYVRYDGLKWMQALFYGIGAAGHWHHPPFDHKIRARYVEEGSSAVDNLLRAGSFDSIYRT